MPEDILSRIVARKHDEVAEARRQDSEETLRAEAKSRRSYRSLIRRLEKPGPSGCNIIAEIKRRSPSKGEMRADLDPAEYARYYQAGGAAAISVLTDGSFFGGSLQDLETARAACHLPVLRKDFVVSSYQVVEAAARGADAVLLIARILDLAGLQELLALCAELRLEALVEVHTLADLATATAAGARLIGINNRDLQTFDTDIGTAPALAARMGPGQIAVAASGIGTRGDIERNLRVGIFNFLVGESLVRADDPTAALRALRGVDSLGRRTDG
ncbi:MAG TPA: indole-3-glycerol phosphate synthase TrpC [Desulfobacteraceae bacterium]|nr:indole-3-glycerol phosphate synthase TrpC [Deltaproteobacteria bacterium]HDI60054.1 indole-3-glycerol phosphate synthase TrpC [Desulfobacteraceae bacterium]